MNSVLTQNKVDFAWIELTNKCNLKCVHCYANSGPEAGEDDILTTEDYKVVLSELKEIGCKNIQFIGGEATVHKDLVELIDHALDLDFETIEIYSNLLFISSNLKQRIVDNNLLVATSFYSYDEAVHDKITQGASSWKKTTKNIKDLIFSGVSLRVSYVEMPENEGHYEETKDFLEQLGVQQLDFDKIRKFGRGSGETTTPEMSELCGQCAEDVLSISPTGLVSPCIMSKPWGVGNLTESSLGSIINSETLRTTRDMILKETNRVKMGSCNPDCTPCNPKSGPNCAPNTNCNPKHSPNCSPKY